MDEDKAEKRRRATPAGLISNGCARHCLEDVRHAINWAAEKSPTILAETLKRGIQSACRELDEEITLYLVAEANAPLEQIDPWHLHFMSSLPLWEALIERGWDINRRSTKQSGLRYRLIDFVCNRERFVVWLIDHGAQLDDGEKDTCQCPPLLQSVAGQGILSLYKRLQEMGAPHGPRELHLAVKESSRFRPHMDMVRFLVDEIGCDVNQLDGDEYFNYGHTNMAIGPPLWWAIQDSKGGEAAVQFLLERGADPCLNGMDLSKDAEERGNQGVLAVLQEWKNGNT